MRWQAKLLKLEEVICKKGLTKEQSVRPPVLGPIGSWGRVSNRAGRPLLLMGQVKSETPRWP